MITCQHCRRQTQNYLCDDCTNQLHDMLTQIPWLLDELDNRIQKLDRINLGTIGRTRRPDELTPIDFDAVDLARTTRKTLLKWVVTVAERHTGRRPQALDTVTTADLARWLAANTHAIARLDLANTKGRHQLYDDINHLVGTNQQGAQLIRAINPTEHHLVGPCPTITGRNHDGTPRQCGHMLYADTYDRTVTCPTCNQDINVEDNRRRAAADRDLHTRTNLLDVLANIDEPVDPDRLDAWIRARRLRPAGYLHANDTIIEFRIHPADEPVYSFDRARKLRRRDHSLTGRKSRA
ncbi:MAG: DUF1922 domain-containing protein [Actinomycetota bacterium]|nr:DUF1922 domain-containing protein [Actinomycetota bacterium]